MFARLTLYGAAPETRQTQERLFDELDALWRGQQGCQNIIWLIDDTTGEYGSFSLWDSEEAAEAAENALRPRIQELWAGSGFAPTTTGSSRYFEVYEVNG